MMRNKVIWLMGGSGSGKTTAAQVFAELGFFVIDADQISREILEKDKSAYCEVVNTFGEDFLLADGNIDRKKLGAAVFSDSEKLTMLNKITHKYIRREINKKVEESNANVLIDAALPPKEFCECDRVICVTAPLEVRVERIMARDSISRNSALDRINSQIPDAQYAELADACFENSGDVSELRKKIIDWCIDEKII